MKICVIGLGYIGFPTALLLSSNYEVTGCDINEDLVNKIKNKIVPFFEPGIEELFDKTRLKAETHPVRSDVFLICVPTPFDKEVKMADLRYVKGALESIISVLAPGNLVIIESTITPGTSEKIAVPILERSGLKVGEDIHLSHCPERAIPGKTLYEMVQNDRIIGGIDQLSTDLTEEIYRTYVKGKIYKTNIRTAEFVKLIENTYRDVNIALANEIAMLSEEMGINIWEAIDLANKHPRVNIHFPGPGVGGHCIAVDPWFLTENSINATLITTAREINDNMPSFVVNRVKRILKDHGVLNPTVSVFGVAYKANVDDTRETPALKLIKLCEKEGWTVRVFDPNVKKFEYPLLTLEKAIDGTDIIIIETGHDQFKSVLSNPDVISCLNNKIVLDCHNMIDKSAWRKAGFSIYTLGDGTR